MKEVGTSCNTIPKYDSLEAAIKAYEAHFGTAFTLYIGDYKTDQELIQEIQTYIQTGKRQQKPQYCKGIIY